MHMEAFALHEIDSIAARIIDTVRKQKMRGVALSGNLGAGKTALAQALARHLGVQGTVISPTFILMKRYETNTRPYASFIHVDAYRIESAAEAAGLRLSESAPDAFICVEWPEHMFEALPPNMLQLSLTYVSDDKRAIMGL